MGMGGGRAPQPGYDIINCDNSGEFGHMPRPSKDGDTDLIPEGLEHPDQDADDILTLDNPDGPVPMRRAYKLPGSADNTPTRRASAPTPEQNIRPRSGRASFPSGGRDSAPQPGGATARHPSGSGVPHPEGPSEAMGNTDSRIPIIGEHLRYPGNFTPLADVTMDRSLAKLHRGKRCIELRPEENTNPDVIQATKWTGYHIFEPKAPNTLFCSVIMKNGLTAVMVNSEVVKSYVVVEKTRYGNILSLFTVDGKGEPSVTQLVEANGSKKYCLNDNYWGLMKGIYELNKYTLPVAAKV
ncbi:collagen adhesion protein, putative [Babesia ovata]|uniref:Collagen adhesion protein, putative n=1 Tax=Babesia ovata TaxID=189622 RepID=A0A2H6K7J9_9APIC|nr:collagen adhesion protein, putative [Babesia ovata]GBE58973.1 collagen adhesion protein, putative [Babesia ovata]